MSIADLGQSLTALFFTMVAVLIIFKGIRMVPQGHHWTVERFGKYTRTLSPGLHLLVPFIDAVGRKLNMMEQVLDVDPQEIISSDNADRLTDSEIKSILKNAPTED